MKKLCTVLLIGLYGCSPAIRAYFDYDKEDNIRNYKTFTWEEASQTEKNGNPLYYSELNDKRIRAAANDLMQAKGYVRSEQNPDLTLHYHIVMEERSMLAPDPYGYMYGDYFMRPRSDLFSYREGTLIIDFMRTKKQNLVWRGWAVAAMEVVLYDTKDTDILIRSAVAKIFQNFPESRGNVDLTVTFHE
ncbi:DUF4136 domain-containing protein [Dyadobacter psychrotolerans]|uniref:DUF4136 domain-containing protein n=1 Tax=Dyadobacter psychrotolerans TaxID=2541721 RepID=A0A4R5DD08_9BACT|nr:DUF4136 domain-containing protein [Dyadobacter psychrotolerans]TDE08153.1 DUF4136 domain-containing protein [Dyadobacter psychrotolerans]